MFSLTNSRGLAGLIVEKLNRIRWELRDVVGALLMPRLPKISSNLIFCLDIMVRGEHIKKRGFSPPPRPEEHILEGAGFQKTNEPRFIGNNGARVVQELGKLCVCWEKEVIMVLAPIT